jgi:hypothetical protein
VYLAEVRAKEKPNSGTGAGAVLLAAKVMDRKELEGRNKEGRARTERGGRGPPVPAAALRRRRGGERGRGWGTICQRGGGGSVGRTSKGQNHRGGV